jgi:hypothetical protein
VGASFLDAPSRYLPLPSSTSSYPGEITNPFGLGGMSTSGAVTFLKVSPWVSWGCGFVLFQVSSFNVVVIFVATVSSHGLRSSTIIFVGLFLFFEIITRLLNGGLIPLKSSSPSPLFGAVWRERWDHNASSLHVLFCGYLNSVATVLLSSIFSSASSCSFITSQVDPWMVVRLLKVSSVQLMVRLSF